MKIGVFTNCYLPLVNGVVGAITLLKKGITEQGHQVYIFAPGYDDYIDEDDVFRYPAVDLTRKVKFPVAIPFSPRISSILRDINLDIIHSHHPFVLGPASVKVARRKRVPSIYTFHTQYDHYTHYVPLPKNLVKEFSKHKIRKHCDSVTQITTPADSARRILQGYGIKRSIEVIPNPMDLTRFQNRDGGLIREKYRLHQEKLLINIGRVAPEKNLPLLLNIYQYILNHAHRNTTRLMILGDGPDLPKLRQQAERMGIAENVIFTGLVNPSEIPEYLAAADLFVMTSFTEVKPLAQLESLAAGLPIVAISAPGADDTIVHGENGLLVSKEIPDFGEAVLGLLFDPDRLRRYRVAALKTAARYSHSKIAADYLNLYERTIANYRNR